MSDSFRETFVALIPMLRGFASTLARSKPEADDLVQETLARAWKYRLSFQDDTNMKSWLCKILQNCFYRNEYRQRFMVEDVDGHLAALQSTAPSQEWRLQYSEMLTALNQVSTESRNALVLVGAYGLTYEEAAKVADCPIGTLKSRVNRARERLTQLLHMADVSKPSQSNATPQIAKTATMAASIPAPAILHQEVLIK